MRKLIDGKVYDTETAEAIASGHSPTHDCGNFRYWSETLYRTPKGRWFVTGEGGPMTRWRSYNGNSYGWGKGLEAMTPGEAREWCEANDVDVDTVRKFFDVEDA